MHAVAIILARGGSKGIPRKNLRHVYGRTLLDWAIQAATDATTIRTVYVSTEDAEIAAEARRHGATVIDRPMELATDAATSAEALLHAIDHIEPEADVIVDVPPTCPTQTGMDIDQVVVALDTMNADSAISVWREQVCLWRRGPDGYGVPLNQFEQKCRQESPPEYVLSGAAVAARRDIFLRTRQLICGRIALVNLDELQVDINDPVDLKFAEIVLHERTYNGEIGDGCVARPWRFADRTANVAARTGRLPGRSYHYD